MTPSEIILSIRVLLETTAMTRNDFYQIQFQNQSETQKQQYHLK